ncbi:PUA-like domain-containing protein [Boletus reticuloceps]|uniref:PUA-like domain-containing protein n=1 Tax=Boletus reticuloceps TaxID=495285 RepID=A0A8I2YLY5_9AGAM|nr:PUA-like domain-containing protein [Boletus reticuloceps]
MTTTMDSHVDIENSVQTPPQESARTSPPPNHGLSLAPTVPENTATPRPPLARDVDDNAARTQAKRQNDELRALAFAHLFLDYLLLTNVASRFSSKTFGNIPNVPIFTQWDYRKGCSDSAVHRSFMAGICGNRIDGAYSIVLSSLYKDNEDRGDVIIYTGAGGRKRWTDAYPPKRLRVGPQIFDQSWDDPANRALIVSSLTRNPVRVIRSWKCRSEYAPVKGYRYDGIYTVTNIWTATGQNKKKVCRCRLERLPDQPPIPVRPLTLSASRRKRGEPLVSRLTCSPSPSTHACDTSGIDSDTGPNYPATQLAGSIGGGSEGLLNHQQQRATPEAPAGIEFNMIAADNDVKHEQQQHPSPHHIVPAKPGALPRYRWDPETNQLIRLPAPPPMQESPSAAEGEEEYRGEDDVTLVPSEDSRAGVEMMPANERLETEYFSDRGNSPQIADPDEPRTSGDWVMESKGDN